MPATLLDRPYLTSSFPALEPTPLQSQVDGLVGGFVEQATDWRSLTAMMAGGLAYRMGRIGTLSVGVQNFEALRKIASVGIGLGAEVTAFEMTNRSLASLAGENRFHSNLWRWEGQGGIRQGLLNSLVTFGTLKGAGRLAQGENVVVQHFLQDTAMVLGHQVSGALGITPRPMGSLAEQFLHAEATNLQLGAGMALAHAVAPGIQGMEKGLDLSLRSHSIGVHPSGYRQNFEPLQSGPSLAFAVASGHPGPSEPTGQPFILAMEGAGGSGGETSLPPVREKEYWFPLRGGSRRLLSVKYNPLMNRLLEDLMEQIRGNPLDRTLRPDERLLSLTWIYQILDLGTKLNAPMILHENPACLLEPLRPHQASRSPEALEQALGLLRKDGAGAESEWVVEMAIPYEEVSFGQKENEKSTEIGYILESIEGNLLNTVRLAESFKGEGLLRVRFPTPPLLERLLRVTSGERAPRFHYVEKEISRDGAMDLKSQGAIAIGYSRDPLVLRDLGVKVPAVIFTLHDLFHAASLTHFSLPFRQYAGSLYHLVRKSSLRRYSYTREHLNRLVDLDPPLSSSNRLESFFVHIFGHMVDHYREDFETDDDIQFKAILKYRNFLEDYLRLLEANMPANSQWAELQGQLIKQLRPLFWNINSLLQEIVKILTPYVFPKQK